MSQFRRLRCRKPRQQAWKITHNMKHRRRWFQLKYCLIDSCCKLCWLHTTARPWTQHDCHHDMKVNPEAATAVIELLMMGWKTPKTCWAVNKRQDNKLENCCIWLVIYSNWNTTQVFTWTEIQHYKTENLYFLPALFCDKRIFRSQMKSPV
jgi:hypothetical protein